MATGAVPGSRRLHTLVRAHLETFLREAAHRGAGLPQHEQVRTEPASLGREAIRHTAAAPVQNGQIFGIK